MSTWAQRDQEVKVLSLSDLWQLYNGYLRLECLVYPTFGGNQAKCNVINKCPVNYQMNTRSSTSSLWTSKRVRRGRSVGNQNRKKPTVQPSSSKADVDRLQEVGSETEETGDTDTGTGELVGRTLEGGSGGGCLWCDDGANGSTSGSRGRCGGCRPGLFCGWRGGDGGGEWHHSAAGKGTFRHGHRLAGGGSVGADRGWLGHGDGLAGHARNVGGCAEGVDDGGEGGWAWAHADVGAWCGHQQSGGAWADDGRGGH